MERTPCSPCESGFTEFGRWRGITRAQTRDKRRQDKERRPLRKDGDAESWTPVAAPSAFDGALKAAIAHARPMIFKMRYKC